MGKVVFTEGETAFLNEELVAEVQDPDDHGGDLGEPYEGVHVQTWQWSRWDVKLMGRTGFEDIAGETTNRYTPDGRQRVTGQLPAGNGNIHRPVQRR